MDSPRPATTSAYTCQIPKSVYIINLSWALLLITRMFFHCSLSKCCIQTICESSELCKVEIELGVCPCHCTPSQCRIHMICELS